MFLPNLKAIIDKATNTKPINIGWKGSMAKIVEELEYGRPDMEARPHRDDTIAIYRYSWGKDFAASMRKSSLDPETSLDYLSKDVHEDYLEVLYSGEFAELMESTIIKRHRDGYFGDEPLVRSGFLQDSLEIWHE